MGLGPYQRSELGSPKRILWRASQVSNDTLAGCFESSWEHHQNRVDLQTSQSRDMFGNCTDNELWHFSCISRLNTLRNSSPGCQVKRWAIPLADEARLVNLENATTIGFGSIWRLTFETKNRNLLENIKIAVNILARSLCGTSFRIRKHKHL